MQATKTQTESRPKNLLEQVQDVIQLKHYARSTGQNID